MKIHLDVRCDECMNNADHLCQECGSYLCTDCYENHEKDDDHELGTRV